MIILYIIPFISAVIGWFTNYLAIKMLFHPRERKNIIGIKLQGIFPKRKHVLAERLARAINRDLFSMEIVKNKLDESDTKEKLKKAILVEIEDLLKNKFKSANKMLAMFLTDSIINQVLKKADEHLNQVMPRLVAHLSEQVEQINVQQVIQKKIIQFSNEKFEHLLMSVIKKELKFIEVIGAVLGFLIGLVQIGILQIGRQHYF